MKRHPSEYRSCTRCGVRRSTNNGKKRKAKETGLCRDCFHVVYTYVSDGKGGWMWTPKD